MKVLNDKIVEKCNNLLPDQESISRMEDTFQCIFSLLDRGLRDSYPDFQLLKYGSTVNGLAQRGDADLDLTIMINDLKIDHEEVLKKAGKIIKKHQKRFRNPFIRTIKSGTLLVF